MYLDLLASIRRSTPRTEILDDWREASAQGNESADRERLNNIVMMLILASQGEVMKPTKGHSNDEGKGVVFERASGTQCLLYKKGQASVSKRHAGPSNRMPLLFAGIYWGTVRGIRLAGKFSLLEDLPKQLAVCSLLCVAVVSMLWGSRQLQLPPDQCLA